MAGDVLFLAHRLPYPPDRGDKMRSYHLLRHIAARAPVHLVCFADDAGEIALAETLRPMLASLHVERRRRSRLSAGLTALPTGRAISVDMFASSGLRAHVDRLVAGGRIGTIFAFSSQMAQFAPIGWRGRLLMDFVDVDSAKFAAYGQQSSGVGGWVYRREGRRLAVWERAVAARADVSLFVSEQEAALFRKVLGRQAGRIAVLENGIDLDRYDPAGDFARLSVADRGEGPLAVFTGQMDYRPNIEAVSIFARHALPLVRARMPGTRFAIVGRDPSPAVKALGNLPGVTVTGAVADVRGWIAAADVVVAPLRLARGVQNKVLEAMAMGRPVIASPAAFEGIDAVSGSELVVADGSAAEAEAVVALLADQALAAGIGKRARARMVVRYGWDAQLAALDGLLGLGGRSHREEAA